MSISIAHYCFSPCRRAAAATTSATPFICSMRRDRLPVTFWTGPYRFVLDTDLTHRDLDSLSRPAPAIRGRPWW